MSEPKRYEVEVFINGECESRFDDDDVIEIEYAHAGVRLVVDWNGERWTYVFPVVDEVRVREAG